jgi:hypothetical protein
MGTTVWISSRLVAFQLKTARLLSAHQLLICFEVFPLPNYFRVWLRITVSRIRLEGLARLSRMFFRTKWDLRFYDEKIKNIQIASETDKEVSTRSQHMYFLYVFWLKFCMHSSSLPCMLHASLSHFPWFYYPNFWQYRLLTSEDLKWSSYVKENTKPLYYKDRMLLEKYLMLFVTRIIRNPQIHYAGKALFLITKSGGTYN